MMSRFVPPPRDQLVAIGAGLGQLVHMVHQCIHAYIWHLRQDVPLVPSHPIPSHPVWAHWWLLLLGWDNWSTWSINVYMHIYGISGKMSHLSRPIPSRPIPSYFSNHLRYRLDPWLIGKVFESTFQILKNGISMTTSLATRCKTP